MVPDIQAYYNSPYTALAAVPVAAFFAAVREWKIWAPAVRR